ncbi:hypothetical protein [Pseudoxanthomonas sp.]|uniref:hypothetical protein n=1 Tax=Pseudoxanthomonas sp. TaxID=1871049 RepID=UPI0025D12B33|nr:hypothetical protein [Pseudoxanthomonas sp.]
MGDVMTGSFGLLIMLFCAAVAILWIVLPFAVFGIKGRLDDLIAEQRRTNELLASRGPPE